MPDPDMARDGLLAAVPDDPGPASVPGPRCSIGRLRATLGPNDLAKLDRMMAPESGWQHADISRRLEPIFGKVNQGSIGKHRRGDCGCDRVSAA